MKKILVAAICVLGMAACGGSSFDNAKACKDYVAKVNALSCMPEASKVSDSFCDAYKSNTICDYSKYFTCLGDAYKCEGDTLDTSGVSSCSATCN